MTCTLTPNIVTTATDGHMSDSDDESEVFDADQLRSVIDTEDVVKYATVGCLNQPVQFLLLCIPSAVVNLSMPAGTWTLGCSQLNHLMLSLLQRTTCCQLAPSPLSLAA